MAEICLEEPERQDLAPQGGKLRLGEVIAPLYLQNSREGLNLNRWAGLRIAGLHVSPP